MSEKKEKTVLNICHLYPDLMNTYGDLGNIIALKKRAEWREIDVRISNVSIGDKFDGSKYDIVFIGGGQDFEQEIIYKDIIEQKGSEIKNAVKDDTVFLCICGGYQLMGKYYKTADGKEIKGLDAINVWTEAGQKRLIGNLIFEATVLGGTEEDMMIVGFENHSGRTFLGKNVVPLGIVRYGNGNNGEDRTEGAIHNNVYCSYSHGSLLPKNYRLTDHLLQLALKRKYGKKLIFADIGTEREEEARISMMNRLLKRK